MPPMSQMGHSRHSRHPGVSSSPQSGHPANARVYEYAPYGAGDTNLLKSRRSAHAGCRAVRDSTLVAWYRFFTHLARKGRMTVTIGRRELLAALGGAAAAWPLAARAQQGERMRRIGVLMGIAADDPAGQVRLAAFLQGLQQLGWTEGRNVRIDIRWGAGDAERNRALATELVALAPDVILATFQRGSSRDAPRHSCYLSTAPRAGPQVCRDHVELLGSTRDSSGSSSRRHFVERERKTRRAIAVGERDMLAQNTDESFRADHVRFRNAGGAVVQVLMRSDFFATEAFFCDHGRHPFLEQRRGPGGLRVVAPRIMSSGTPHCSAIESNTAPSGSCKSAAPA